jgi:hypothetical protein
LDTVDPFMPGGNKARRTRTSGTGAKHLGRCRDLLQS